MRLGLGDYLANDEDYGFLREKELFACPQFFPDDVVWTDSETFKEMFVNLLLKVIIFVISL